MQVSGVHDTQRDNRDGPAQTISQWEVPVTPERTKTVASDTAQVFIRALLPAMHVMMFWISFRCLMRSCGRAVMIGSPLSMCGLGY